MALLPIQPKKQDNKRAVGVGFGGDREGGGLHKIWKGQAGEVGNMGRVLIK